MSNSGVLLLVHEYAEVDLREVYRVLQERLEDFREFARYIGNYILEYLERE